ncbi:MAG: nickel-responsive transcriptional regulator NikR [Candidatus Omnitrophota bacterium]
MESKVRFGVSIDEDLLEKLDTLLKRKGYDNRSEGLRDMIREKLVEEEWEGGEVESFGTVSLVFSHESRELAQKLIAAQHKELAHIVASLHVHVDQHHCLEVLVLRGRGREIKKLGDMLVSTKGVKHGKTNFTTMGILTKPKS